MLALQAQHAYKFLGMVAEHRKYRSEESHLKVLKGDTPTDTAQRWAGLQRQLQLGQGSQATWEVLNSKLRSPALLLSRGFSWCRDGECLQF
jgi:hypothetical protein